MTINELLQRLNLKLCTTLSYRSQLQLNKSVCYSKIQNIVKYAQF